MEPTLSTIVALTFVFIIVGAAYGGVVTAPPPPKPPRKGKRKKILQVIFGIAVAISFGWLSVMIFPDEPMATYIICAVVGGIFANLVTGEYTP